MRAAGFVVAGLMTVVTVAPALAQDFPGGGATGGTFPGGGATNGVFPGGGGNASVATVEPSVLALTGAGLLCATLFRRRR